MAHLHNLWILACRAKKDRCTEARKIVERALRVEAVRCGKKALRKMQGQEKTDARMHAMNACIKAVLQQDFYMLPMWAQDL